MPRTLSLSIQRVKSTAFQNLSQLALRVFGRLPLHVSSNPIDCSLIVDSELVTHETSTNKGSIDTQNIREVLQELESLISQHRKVSIDLPRNLLRKTAALLCNHEDFEPSIISHLVNVPFHLFTKDSIKMGISLWLGVINENPETEPRLIAEIAQAWERTIHRRKGLFDPSLT